MAGPPCFRDRCAGSNPARRRKLWSLLNVTSRGIVFLRRASISEVYAHDRVDVAPVDRLAGLIAMSVSAFAQQPQAQPSFKWWQSEQFQKDLGLTPDQVARIDAIFQATLPELRQRKDELDVLETQVVASHRDGYRRGGHRPPRRQDRSRARSFEQDAHVDADADASGAQARSAGPVQGAARTVGPRATIT